VCTSGNPLNQRTRASIAIANDNEVVLIDTAPEMRLQILRAGIKTLRAVFYTHLHADHAHGFDDLRAFQFRSKRPLDVYLLPEMIPELKERFKYAFEPTGYSGAIPHVRLHAIEDTPFQVGAFFVEPIRLPHGHVQTCGFKVANFAYITDFKTFPEDRVADWQDRIDVMVASGIHFGQHSSHSVIPETIDLFRTLRVKRGIISHLAHEVDHEIHSKSLPKGVEFAFDGMEIDLNPTVS
jgi:phosphoribosyl 1,2-cyclic phosphate phosphodiesterase